MLSFFKKKQLKKLIIMAVSVLSLTQVLSFATPSFVYAEDSSSDSDSDSGDDSDSGFHCRMRFLIIF